MPKKRTTHKQGLVGQERAERSQAGKLGLTVEGRKRLRFLRATRDLRLSNIVRPRKPTAVKKRVLFVCRGGIESSFSGLNRFKELAKKAPVDATLVLDYTGWQLSNSFTRNILRADFVVPMVPGARIRIEKVVATTRFKPLIVDPGFKVIHDQGDLNKYRQILEEIRASLEKKEKKGK